MAREAITDATLVGPGLESAPDRFYPSIAGLRGVAALSVIFAHIYLMSAHGGFYPRNLPAALAPSLEALGCSTGLFFVISGFVDPGESLSSSTISSVSSRTGSFG
jgi:surface polysaccharide O-acyltransferase-like enzyme